MSAHPACNTTDFHAKSQHSGLNVIVQECRTRASPTENIWTSFSTFLPVTYVPTEAQIKALRNIVFQLKGLEVQIARYALGDNVWCLLIFAGIPGYESCTLVQTTVGSVDISEWDVMPMTFEVPCIACGDETPCQETYDGGISACRECLLADKKCSFLSTKGHKLLLKRKRETRIEGKENPHKKVYVHPVAASVTMKLAKLEDLDFEQCRMAIAKMARELKQALKLGHELKDKLWALMVKDNDALVAINNLRRKQDAEMACLMASFNGN